MRCSDAEYSSRAWPAQPPAGGNWARRNDHWYSESNSEDCWPAACSGSPALSCSKQNSGTKAESALACWCGLHHHHWPLLWQPPRRPGWKHPGPEPVHSSRAAEWRPSDQMPRRPNQREQRSPDETSWTVPASTGWPPQRGVHRSTRKPTSSTQTSWTQTSWTQTTTRKTLKASLQVRTALDGSGPAQRSMLEPDETTQTTTRTARTPDEKEQTTTRTALRSDERTTTRQARRSARKAQSPDETKSAPDAQAQVLRKPPAALWSQPGEPAEQPNLPDVRPPAGHELFPRCHHHSGCQT